MEKHWEAEAERAEWFYNFAGKSKSIKKEYKCSFIFKC